MSDLAETATINGTLNVSLIDGFESNSADSFEIMTFGSRTGTFSTITGAGCGIGKAVAEGYGRKARLPYSLELATLMGMKIPPYVVWSVDRAKSLHLR